MGTKEDVGTIAWADVGKAACVCLIVLMHGESQIAVSGWEQSYQAADIWHDINGFIRPIRLPTFFLISGLLCAKHLNSKRIDSDHRCFVKPMYLHILWASIFALLIPNYPMADHAAISLVERLQMIALIASPGWYLFGLALFYLIAKATRDMPDDRVLGACALVSILGSLFLADQGIYAAKLPRCLVFFVAGVRLKDAIQTFADSASPQRALILFGLYGVGAANAAQLDTYLLPVDAAAVAFSITLWSLAYRNLGRLAAPIRWVGRRTLLIYLLHFPLICLMSTLVRSWIDPGIRDSFWLAFLYPVATTVVTVPLSLTLGVLLQRAGMNLLFDLPPPAPAPADSAHRLPTTT